MAESKLKYYNMVVHLIKNNRLYEENAAIKNVWQKDGNIFFDIYFYRNRKSYVFDSAFIHDLMDLTNEKYYPSPAGFLKDFAAETPRSEAPLREEKTLIDKKLFAPLDVDLVILTFIADCCHNFIVIKEKIIFDYIRELLPATANLSLQYVSAYLHSLRPGEGEFYHALSVMAPPTPEAAVNLLKECVKICLSDGQLQYNEKLYLAEIVQTLRENGITPDVGL